MFSVILIFLGFSHFTWADEGIIIDANGKVRAADAKKKTPTYTSPKINIDFHQADIHSVMRFFAKVGKTNIILSEGIQGKVTMRLEGVHWEEAFLAVLWSQALMAQPMENMQFVSPRTVPR